MSIDDTLRLIAANPRIPTPSAVVLRVLEKARHADCSLAELGQLLSTDPGLSSKILKTVNSALFGLSRPVLSVQRALGMIGLNAARAMVLSLSLPEMSRGLQSTEQLRRYWKRSLTCAVSARELSRRLHRPDAEEDLAAGLLCDVGAVMLQQALPGLHAEALEAAGCAAGMLLCELEQQYCGVSHAQVGAHVLRGWRFPDDFADAIAHHHAPAQASPAARQRAAMLCLASQVADLLADVQGHGYRDLLMFAEREFGMSEKAVQDFIAPLQPKMMELAQILNVDAGAWDDSAAIMARAAEELVVLTVSASQQSHRAEAARAQAQEEADRWRDEAVFDHLTHLYNRRFFLERFREEFARSRRCRRGLGLFFIDLDGFKDLNDRFGHAFGDRVLCDVARQLAQHVRLEDVVARFGGDEFCVLAWQLDEATLGVLADRLLECIRSHVVCQGNQRGQVGASIGAVVVYPHETTLSEAEILEQADRAMYHAKRTGKNRVHLLSLTEASAQRELILR